MLQCYSFMTTLLYFKSVFSASFSLMHFVHLCIVLGMRHIVIFPSNVICCHWKGFLILHPSCQHPKTHLHKKKKNHVVFIIYLVFCLNKNICCSLLAHLRFEHFCCTWMLLMFCYTTYACFFFIMTTFLYHFLFFLLKSYCYFLLLLYNK